MKTTIQVGTPGVDAEIFTVTATDVNAVIADNKGLRDVLHKSNLAYEININTNELASFAPFSGLGNAWGVEFGFTFGFGDYDPGFELYRQNGLFAMAKFFEQIKWHPYENTAGQELAAEAARGFAKKIADDLYTIGLTIGRPVLPMVWNLSRTTGKSEQCGVEDLTVTITPRVSGGISIVDPHYPENYLTPVDVMMALVFYASSKGYPVLNIGEKPVGLGGLFDLIDRPSKDYTVEAYQASAYGHFAARWPNVDILDTEATEVLSKNQHIVEKIEELLELPYNIGKAAVEIIHMFDAAFGDFTNSLEADSGE